MAWRIFLSGLILSFITLVPLGIKWGIGKKVYIPAAFFIGTLSGTIINGILKFWNLEFYQALVLEIFFITAISISFLLWRFNRDPERMSPADDENTILSPADGKIIYVKKIEDGQIPFSEKRGRKFPLNDFVQSDAFFKRGYLVGISMNFLDVHVNRAPIGGRISLLKHIKGLFISLKKKEAILQNERVFIVIDNGIFKVGVVQIASRLVRKIVPYLREGQDIQRGERIGVIRFGSQVDLIITNLPKLLIVVAPGQKVEAGISIIAKFDRKLL